MDDLSDWYLVNGIAPVSTRLINFCRLKQTSLVIVA
jgi:hypothetical protein